MKTKITDEVLRELSSKLTIREIADQYGYGYDSIRHRLKKLSLNPKVDVKPVVLKDPLLEHKEKTIERYDKQFVNKLLNEKANRDIVIDILKEIVPTIKFIPRPFVAKKTKKVTEQVCVQISDVHIGAYPLEILQKKVDEFLKAIVEITDIRRSAVNIEKIVVMMTGDIVDGDNIYPNQPYNQKFFTMDQLLKGAPVFANFFNELSNHFKEVEINCVWGNHGRVSKFTEEKLNFDHIFYHFLAISTKENSRLKWNIADDWYMLVNVYKWGFLLTHGHYIKTWLNIPFYGIKEKGMRWQGSLTKSEMMEIKNEWVQVRKKFWHYIVMGHFHTTMSFKWNDWWCILSGTWKDHDSFAESVLGLASSTEQNIWFVHPTRGRINGPQIDLSIDNL